MKFLNRCLFALALSLFAATAAQAQLSDRKALTLEAAMKIAAAAEAEATKNNWNVSIAIVDEGGHLVLLHKRDNTQYGSIDISIQKAQTAAGFKRATKVFEDAIAGGRTAILGIEQVLPLEGGVPLVFNGQIVGAIGVSGVTSQQDGVIAKAGADALLGMQ
ncbi:MAG: heme-binding protein [Burkholderiales bacterium]|jgi:glc operon protein GlcG|nr:heme-binding protein [Burkholderiales bacterium]